MTECPIARRIISTLFGSLAAVTQLTPAELPGQVQQSVVRGVVRSAEGVPLQGVNVFIVETLDGALSDSSGRFSFPLRSIGQFTLAARHIGFEPVSKTLTTDSLSSPIALTMTRTAVSLETVRVEAGSYRVDNEQGATLSTIDVVTTPGSAADVYRAIQILPGLQSVDEGTGLYVRGGDFTETRIFLNDAALLNPEQLQTALGTFVGRIDPFQLDGIYFSSGGFGARYGDALSGMAALRTLGAPQQKEGTVSAAIGHFSLGGGLPVSDRFGLRVAGNFSDLDAFLRLNGSPHNYDPAPRSTDASISAMWRYRDGGEMSAFLVDESFRLGVGLNEAAYSGLFRTRVRSRQGIVSWNDKRGSLAWTGSVALAGNRNTDDYGIYRLFQKLDHAQLFTSLEYPLSFSVTARAGAEFSRIAAMYQGSLPEFGYDTRPGARNLLFTADGRGTRIGTFGEIDWRLSSRLRLTAGARTDHSSLTELTTFDPRLSGAIELVRGLSLMFAAGVYHQVPDPLAFVATVGGEQWGSMRASQHIVAIQASSDAHVARIEWYSKRYRDLVAFDQDYQAHGNGTGRASGADILLKTTTTFGMSLRGILSLVDSRRTDPASGKMARAPFDITRSASVVVDWRRGGYNLAAGYRNATGRPFTPVLSATHDPANNRWIPDYGTPMSERLPSFQRLDLSLSHVRQYPSGMMRVLFVSLANVFNRENVSSYYYSQDYSQRLTTPGIFNRSAYFGVMLGSR